MILNLFRRKMKNKALFFLMLMAVTASGFSQTYDDILAADYEKFKEKTIQQKNFPYTTIAPLIEKLKANPMYKVQRLGYSIEKRPINLVSLGNGPTQVLLWSQMHGDESTATMAIFDMFNYFSSDEKDTVKQQILDSLTLHFIPMLNPDGAERFTRRNALNIDLNRDALRLTSPESRILKRVRDSLQPKFGFNLHDQSAYYNTQGSGNTATISVLAPAYNYEKEVNEVRGNAMKMIVHLNNTLQKFIPGKVGRYDDAFEPRAFGDNIQKWGTSAILIESGGYKNDVEKQYIRKLNYIGILSSLHAIAAKSYGNLKVEEYFTIPENDRKLNDLKVKNFSYTLNNQLFTLDLAVNRNLVHKDANRNYYKATIEDLGDLSTFFGYDEVDATGLTWQQGKVYPTVLPNLNALANLDFVKLLREGYTYVRVSNIGGRTYHPYPVQVISPNKKVKTAPRLTQDPTFILTDSAGKPKFAVINGFAIDLENPETTGVHGVVVK